MRARVLLMASLVVALLWIANRDAPTVAATPTPPPLVISISNAKLLQKVQRLGRGTIIASTWTSNTALTVATSLGIWQYNAAGSESPLRPFDSDSGNWQAGGVFNPDKTLLAFADDSQRIHLVEVATGKQRAVFGGLGSVFIPAVAFSPTGSLLAGLGSDGVIHFWDLITSTEQFVLHTTRPTTLQGQGPLVLQFSADGKSLLSTDKIVELWDLVSRKVHVQEGLADERIMRAILSPDGSSIAYSNQVYGPIYLWDVATGAKRKVTNLGFSGLALVFSPDGKYLAFDDGQNVGLYDTTTGQANSNFARADTGITSPIVFSPDGTRLAVADGKNVVVRDVATAKKIAVLEGIGSPIIGFSPDNSSLALIGSLNTTLIWNLSSSQTHSFVNGNARSILDIVFSADGTTVSTGGEDNSARLWDVATGSQLFESVVSPGDQPLFVFNHDGTLLASGDSGGGYDGHFWVRDLRINKEIYSSGKIKGKPLALSPDNSTLAFTDADRVLHLHNLLSGGERLVLTHANYSVGPVFNADWSLIATGDSDGLIQLWDAESGKVIRPLTGFPSEVYQIAFSPNGKYLVGSGSDAFSRIWNVATGAHVAAVNGTGLDAFSPDSRVILFAGYDGNLHLWDVARREERAMLPTNNPAAAFAFSPDSTLLATGDDQGVLSLWSVAAGRLLATYRSHSGRVSKIAFNADGTALASGGEDALIWLWCVRAG